MFVTTVWYMVHRVDIACHKLPLEPVRKIPVRFPKRKMRSRPCNSRRSKRRRRRRRRRRRCRGKNGGPVEGDRLVCFVPTRRTPTRLPISNAANTNVIPRVLKYSMFHFVHTIYNYVLSSLLPSPPLSSAPRCPIALFKASLPLLRSSVQRSVPVSFVPVSFVPAPSFPLLRLH